MYDAGTVLKPGFFHTHELVRWDGTESNRYLYATTNHEVAIDQAVASLLEKRFKATRFRTNGNAIDVWIENKGKEDPDLSGFSVWLYSIFTTPSQGWEKVNNAQNNLDDEWKTREFIGFHRKEHRSLEAWLESRKVTFHKA